MKKYFSYVILFCLLLAMLPVGALATETTEATETVREPGRCGDDLTWSYDSGTLTISGSGDMDNYEEGGAPWQEYKDSITELVISGNVTSIGEYAFTDYDSLKKVDFGPAMHTIGRRAFKSCDGLTTFTLPATFRKFGEECFMGCTWLREVRCLGPMPSFKASCLWDCPVSVFYPTTNPWPAEYVTPLYQSYQGKLQIFMGDGIEEAGKPATSTQTQPIETVPAETVPETTVPETTVPETTVPETTEPETIPTTQPTEAETEETEASRMTEPEWLRETEPVEEEKERSFSGLWFGLFLITGTLSLVLIGALVFRRRSY